MRELLARTGDYGCPAAEAAVPGRPPRHARVIYLCSPAARPVVARAAGSSAPGGADRDPGPAGRGGARDGPGNGPL